MPQTTVPIAGCTAREQVALRGWLKGMTSRDAWAAALKFLRFVELGDDLDKKVAVLSGGMRARVGLAEALVNDPELLLLDEPTASLDPSQRANFWDLIARIKKARTVIVSSHDTTDMERTFDHVKVLNQGRIKFEGTTGSFLGLHSSGRIVDSYRVATEAQ